MELCYGMRMSPILYQGVPMNIKIIGAAACISIISTAALSLDVNVRNAPYNATGNGTTNDRPAIQAAINAVIAAGGGTVTLPAGTYLTGDLQLGSRVTFTIAQNATLKQSQNPDDYAHRPTLGRWRNAPGVNWDGWQCQNYPLLYAGSGCKNVKVTGAGTILKTYTGDDNTSIHIMGIAFFDVDTSEISDVTISNSTAYSIHLIRCRKGLVSNVRVVQPLSCCYNSDGASLMNCQNIRVTGCSMTCRDDGIYIWSSYQDPRKSAWWNSDNPQPSMNIEIDHNTVVQDVNGSGVSFFPWGDEAPDDQTVEISNVNIHDNSLTGGNTWGYAVRLQCLDQWGNRGAVPMKSITFANNNYNGDGFSIEDNPVITDLISDFPDIYAKAATTFQNAGFSNGVCYWSVIKNTKAGSVGSTGGYGFIDSLEFGDAGIYQGLRLQPGAYTFSARVMSSGAMVRMFARNNAGTLLASREFSNTAWANQCISFTVPSIGNYKLGIERGNAAGGWARIDDASLATGNGSCPATRVSDPSSPIAQRKPATAINGQRAIILTMRGERVMVGGNAAAIDRLRPGAYVMSIESARSAPRYIRFVAEDKRTSQIDSRVR